MPDYKIEKDAAGLWVAFYGELPIAMFKNAFDASVYLNFLQNGKITNYVAEVAKEKERE